MFVGEPEDGDPAAGDALDSTDQLDEIAEPHVPRAAARIVPHRAHGTFTGFPTMPYPAWDLLRARSATRCRS